MAFLDDLKKQYENFSMEKALQALQGKRDFSSVLEPTGAVREEQIPVPALAPVMTPEATIEQPTPEEVAMENPELQSDQILEESLAPASVATSKPSMVPPAPKATNEIDFGAAPQDYRALLQDALKRRNERLLMSDLGRATSQIGASIAGGLGGAPAVSVKPTGEEFYKDLAARANLPIEDLKKSIEMQEAQPESRTSKGLKDLIKKQFGIDIKGEPTPEQLKMLLPTLQTGAGLETRKEIAKTMAKERTDRAKLQKEQKEQESLSREQKDTKKRIVDFQKHLDPTGPRSGEFGKLYNTIIQSKRLEALTGGKTNLTPQEMEEFALGLGRLISGTGASSRAQIEALVPKTFRGKTAELQQWLSNNPTGTEQQKFVERMMQTVEREKNTALKEMQNTIDKRISPYLNLKKEAPEDFNKIIQKSYSSLGIDIPKEYELNSSKSKKESAMQANEVKRMTKDGKVAIFDADTKKFLRYEE